MGQKSERRAERKIRLDSTRLDSNRSVKKILTRFHHHMGPEIKQEDPLNLSILLGGGKETNKDSLSNGE